MFIAKQFESCYVLSRNAEYGHEYSGTCIGRDPARALLQGPHTWFVGCINKST